MDCPLAPPPVLPPLRRGTSRKAPRPVGPLAGPRRPWRRFLARLVAALDRSVDRLGAGRLLQRRSLERLSFPTYRVDLSRGEGRGTPLRAAFLSDLHAGCSLGPAEIEGIFAQLAGKEPDLVLLGGDLTNTRTREVLFLERGLARLSPPLGVFAVPGNHDYFEGEEIGPWKALMEGLGVQVLLNRSVRLEWGGKALLAAGVDDLTEGRPDLRAALEAARGEPVILLTHHPDFFFEAAAVGVELTLAGHTHGGQIAFLKPLMGHTKFGYWEGWFREEESRLLVSRGVGTTLLPLRWGAPPEIPILEIRL